MDRETARLLEKLSARVAELEQQLANFPVRWSRPAPVNPPVILLIESLNAGGEYYVVRPLYGAATADKAAFEAGTIGNLAMPVGQTPVPTDYNAIGYNVLGNAQTGHVLGAGDYVVGIKTGTTVDSHGNTVDEYAFSSVTRQCLFPVILENDGGAAATDSSPASWTYTVKNIYNLEPLGTGMSPDVGRDAFAVLAGSFGTGYFDHDGAFHLWQAIEPTDPDNC